jgi:hypothetical protein
LQLLRTLRGTLVCAVTVLALTLSVSQSVAHPSTPEHGLNESTYCTLWAGDTDDPNASEEWSATTDSETALCRLASETDVPLDAPPTAVEAWNRGDLRDFPATNASQSIHPPNATLRDGRFIEDAYTAIFAVQPSTRARIGPSERALYVARNGSVLGTVDYRIVVPANETTEDRRVEWALEEHMISETRVLIDGVVVSNESASPGRPLDHATELPYRITEDSGEHKLALEADISVVLEKRITECAVRENGTCTEWNTTVAAPNESVTVTDSVDVEPYALSVSGVRARYPDGDVGLLVSTKQLWLGYSIPTGDVRGVWRFYAARDTEWDRLHSTSADGQTSRHSPLHPLVVTAYPVESGPSITAGSSVRLLDTVGTTLQPPGLPETVHLDAIEEPYTASAALIVRTEATADETLRAHGIVRGVDTETNTSDFQTVSINESALSLDILNATNTTVTVHVRLVDADTDTPINTTDREGYVRVGDQRVNTSENGTVTTTLTRPTGGVVAQYEPDDWWRSAEPAYVGDSDVAYVRGTWLSALSALYNIGVALSVVLFGVFVIDRLTGWGVWPPWRRM